jgi:hypothetical protein
LKKPASFCVLAAEQFSLAIGSVVQRECKRAHPRNKINESQRTCIEMLPICNSGESPKSSNALFFIILVTIFDVNVL